MYFKRTLLKVGGGQGGGCPVNPILGNYRTTLFSQICRNRLLSIIPHPAARYRSCLLILIMHNALDAWKVVFHIVSLKIQIIVWLIYDLYVFRELLFFSGIGCAFGPWLITQKNNLVLWALFPLVVPKQRKLMRVARQYYLQNQNLIRT